MKLRILSITALLCLTFQAFSQTDIHLGPKWTFKRFPLNDYFVHQLRDTKFFVYERINQKSDSLFVLQIDSNNDLSFGEKISFTSGNPVNAICSLTDSTFIVDDQIFLVTQDNRIEPLTSYSGYYAIQQYGPDTLLTLDFDGQYAFELPNEVIPLSSNISEIAGFDHHILSKNRFLVWERGPEVNPPLADTPRRTIIAVRQISGSSINDFDPVQLCNDAGIEGCRVRSVITLANSTLGIFYERLGKDGTYLKIARVSDDGSIMLEGEKLILGAHGSEAIVNDEIIRVSDNELVIAYTNGYNIKPGYIMKIKIDDQGIAVNSDPVKFADASLENPLFGWGLGDSRFLIKYHEDVSFTNFGESFDVPTFTLRLGTIGLEDDLKQILGKEVDMAVDIFPNPAQDYVTIRFPDNIQGEVQFLDVNGKVLSSSSINESRPAEIEVAHLPEGLYIARISTSDFVVYKRVLVQKK